MVLTRTAEDASLTALHQTVRLTARGSGLLFAAAQVASAIGSPAARASRPLHLAFMAAHTAHFAAVVRYAIATGGRGLFPGGRSLNDVGGWPTLVGIYSLFGALAVSAQTCAVPLGSGQSGRQVAGVGPVATGLIAAMFVGTYLGQLARSKWYAVPAVAIGAATAANILASYHARTDGHPHDPVVDDAVLRMAVTA